MITSPHAYDANDLVLVNVYKNLHPTSQDGNYWSDPTLENLRSKAKSHYIQAQNAKCCYCNRHLGTTNHRNWDLEHIAAREKHAHFLFEPLNLAASCPDCNTSKGAQETLVNTRVLRYPTKAHRFRIVHPHFDEYEEHIHRRGMVYLGKTDKGKRTIYMCDLLRFAAKFIDWENSAIDSSFEKEVDTVFDDDTMSERAVDAIIAQLPVR